jgi:hypothetical protein
LRRQQSTSAISALAARLLSIDGMHFVNVVLSDVWLAYAFIRAAGKAQVIAPAGICQDD